MRNIAVRVLTASLLLAQVAFAQGHHRSQNDALLGIVSAETKKGVVIGHVLKDSPAQKAKLTDGDVLLEINGKTIRRAPDVDAALRSAGAGDKVDVVYTRKGKKATVKATLVARRAYRGALAQQRRGTRAGGPTGHAMLPWYAYKWANVADGEEPPTPENTKGKVLVLHTFQSW